MSDDPDGDWGDRLKDALAAVGVDKEAVERWIGEPCGCEERRVKLNALHGWLRRSVRAASATARNWLIGMIGGEEEVKTTNDRPYTIDELVTRLPRLNRYPELISPRYAPTYKRDLMKRQVERAAGLAVASMKFHMSDEGWQLFDSMRCSSGVQRHDGGFLPKFRLFGRDVEDGNEVDCRVVKRAYQPEMVVVQDEREWNVRSGDFRDERAAFENLDAFASDPEVFRATILKDAHYNPEFHIQSAAKIGVHAWVVYYHPRIVKRVAPYVRKKHLVRTYHTINADYVPAYNNVDRRGVLLSGAVSRSYPLRRRLVEQFEYGNLPGVDLARHPGYHRSGTDTYRYLEMMSKYKVAICTASMYGYALRKIIEATACGCRVVTDLPVDEVIPDIDDNLIRLHPDDATGDYLKTVHEAVASYDPERQDWLATKAKARFDFRVEGKRLVAALVDLAGNY